MDRPRLTVVGGPNGAGKSTFTATRFCVSGIPVLDADAIARSEHVDDREAWRKNHDYAQFLLGSNQSFVVESTLAGRDPSRPSSYIAMMDEAREHGYYVQFVFIAQNSPESHALRVYQRTTAGGHDIPADLIAKRYEISINVRLGEGFDRADSVWLFDNGEEPFRALLAVKDGTPLYISEKMPEWAVRGLGSRLPNLLARDRDLLIEQARISFPQAHMYEPHGVFEGTVLAVGAAHMAMLVAQTHRSRTSLF